MAEKTFNFSKITAVILIFCLTIPVFAISTQTSAEAKSSKVKYCTVTTSKNKTYSTGIKAKTYYKRIVLKGKSAGIKKINKYLKKQSKEFMQSQGVKDIHSAAKNIESSYTGETYLCYAKSKVSYNNKNVISIRITSVWYMGGVVNTTRYGYTFNVKTGKRLKFKDVSKYSSKKAVSVIYKKIKTSDSMATIKKDEIKTKNLDFYLKPNSKLVVCFGPYEVGCGGWFRTYTIKSKFK